MTSRNTKLTVKSKKSAPSEEDRTKLQARAARFGIASSTRKSNSNLKLKNPNAKASAPKVALSPAEAEKLAARASRFADVNKLKPPVAATSGVVSTTTPMRTTMSSADAEILAKRAARFSSVPMETTTTSKVGK